MKTLTIEEVKPDHMGCRRWAIDVDGERMGYLVRRGERDGSKELWSFRRNARGYQNAEWFEALNFGFFLKYVTINIVVFHALGILATELREYQIEVGEAAENLENHGIGFAVEVL